MLVLVERGLVDLDKSVNDYLGESKLTAFAGSAEDATVKRILVHTAGLPMHWKMGKSKLLLEICTFSKLTIPSPPFSKEPVPILREDSGGFHNGLAQI